MKHGPLTVHYASLADLIDDAHTAGISDHKPRWRYGTEWRDEPTTRAGLLAGDAPPSVVAEYESARARFGTLSASHPAPTRRRRQVWADQGDEVDADRMLSDHANPWRNTRAGREAPIIRLGVSVAVSVKNGPAAFAELAAALATLTDRFTLAGFGVEIIGCHASLVSKKAPANHHAPTVYTFPLKAATDPLDIRRLLSIGAPGLCRAYCHPLIWRDRKCPVAGLCVMPNSLPDTLGTPHIVAQHWHEGMREVPVAEQVRRIIAANNTPQHQEVAP